MVRATGEPYPVPEDVGLTVYRISQEALTNVLKHAGPARAEVHLHYGEDLELDRRSMTVGARPRAWPSRPRPARAAATPGCGNGPRCWAAGSAGPRAGGGYQVHATLPSERDSGPAVPAQRESEPH